jgi:6-pyruvoyltetrahydropterin/6-carboxytetrahydropterin synthase
MYGVRVEARFAAAHFLADYHGKCERLHGHNYRVRVWAEGDGLDAGGMLLDFGTLKNALNEVFKPLDHGLLNDLPEFDRSPSAERLAEFVWKGMKRLLPDAKLSRVDVYETDANMASYWEP